MQAQINFPVSTTVRFDTWNLIISCSGGVTINVRVVVPLNSLSFVCSLIGSFIHGKMLSRGLLPLHAVESTVWPSPPFSLFSPPRQLFSKVYTRCSRILALVKQSDDVTYFQIEWTIHLNATLTGSKYQAYSRPLFENILSRIQIKHNNYNYSRVLFLQKHLLLCIALM